MVTVCLCAALALARTGDKVEEQRAIPCSGRNGKGGQVGRSGGRLPGDNTARETQLRSLISNPSYQQDYRRVSRSRSGGESRPNVPSF